MGRDARCESWREEWEALTGALEVELGHPDVDPDRVAELVDARQRLIAGGVAGATEERPTEAQRAWLEAALSREAKLREGVGRLLEELGAAVASAKGAATVQRQFGGAFGGEDERPRLLDGSL